MNVEAYISSGILELYVLGDLDPQERKEVESYAAEYREVRLALDQIERDMMALDMALAREVSSEVKEGIFERLGEESSDENIRKLPEPAAANERGSTGLIAASVSLLALAIAAAVYFYFQWQSSENDYQQLALQNQVLADNVQETRQSLDRIESELSLVTSDNTLEIPLNGLPLQPEAQAYVYFQPENQAVYLKVVSLIEPGQLNDYQLWAIVDGKPVDVGIINLNTANLLQQMKSVRKASAFAVTLEPKGGSENPTLDQMVVLGEVKA